MRRIDMLEGASVADHTPVTALVFADTPAAALNVAGLSVLGRQLKQLHRLGVRRAVIFAPQHQASLRQAAAADVPQSQELIFADTPQQLGAAMARCGSGPILVTRGHALLDSRIFAALLDHPADHVVACLHGGALKSAEASTIAAVKTQAQDLHDSDSFDQLIARLDAQAVRVDMDAYPTYDPELRRPQPMLYEVLTDARDTARLTGLIIARTQKGTLDWPARFLHPPFENLLTRLIARTPVTPNQVSLFVALLGFVVTWYLAQGRWAVALPLALFVGVLDGVDGKLSRTKLMQTRIGQAEHVLDKVVEYSWYLALAFHFAPAYGAAVWALALVIGGFAAAEAIQGEFYRRLTGTQLDDAGSFERKWRLVAGRRNTFMWTFTVCVVSGLSYAGFWLLAIYAMVTFFVAQVCFIVRLMAYASGNSDIISRNVQRTSY